MCVSACHYYFGRRVIDFVKGTLHKIININTIFIYTDASQLSSLYTRISIGLFVLLSLTGGGAVI